MAHRISLRLLTAILASLALLLAACVSDSPAPARATSTAADEELVDQADVMQKTILEGAVAGAAAGGGISIGLGGDNDDINLGTLTGAGIGAAAGTYVAFIQRRYTRKVRRLREIREDLDENSEEMQAAIAVMRRVLDEQKAQIVVARGNLATGAEDPEALARTVQVAQANLTEMQRAVDGATARRSEFVNARGLVSEGSASEIDPQLAELAATIATMRSIAEDLEQELAI